MPVVCALFLFFVLTLVAQAQTQPPGIEGIIVDESGAPVANAQITLSNGSADEAIGVSTSDADGRFAVAAIPVDVPAAVLAAKPAGATTLRVQASGFATVERDLKTEEIAGKRLNIVLSPAAVAEQVTVTAARTPTRLSDTAASVVVLSQADLLTTAAQTLDDVLRQVPGFNVFRRSSSRTANPTTQGVSLRGVGASGASRAVVLADNIPINDPFGGWVYWGRVPRQSLDRVEVLRGGGSDLYGSAALGGVISVLTRKIDKPIVSFEASYGNQQTPDASLFTAGSVGQWGASLAAESFHTDGYVIIDRRERGIVDTAAGSRRANVDLTLERQVIDDGRVFARGSYYGEARDNGTPLQTNRTHIRQLSFGSDLPFNSIGTFALRAYGGTQVYDQNFSAVAADRNSETLTRIQRVPAQFAGVSGQWSRAVGGHQVLIAGFDGREVRGASDELIYVAGRPSSLVGAGGRERTLGAFVEDIISVRPRLIITAGARVDRWRNYEALSTTRTLARPNDPTVENFFDRTQTAFNPRLSVLYKLTDDFSVTASGYRGFRAPTLNELYRAFRVGDVLTLANENLQAERLTGGEAGANYSSASRQLVVRGTFFWSEITRPIANVTLQVAPTLITRQRQNLGRTRSRGVELEADARLTNNLFISGGYQFADAQVTRFPANLLLEGLLVPQVPRHLMTFQVRYVRPELATFGLQGRAVGVQFDDDQNRFPLGKYLTLDGTVSRRIASGVELFAAAENLLDQPYTVGRTPIRTIGTPRLVRLGFRLRLGSQ